LIRREYAPVIILGAGPAGLTAAYELSAQGVSSIILEQDAVVGGLARTIEHNGYRFDIGGHRFYTKLPYIEKIWKDVLGEDLLVRRRLSRIYYRSKFFRYPLEPADALLGLGPVEALRCLGSFTRARFAPSLPESDFATWVSNRFGRRLFETFFKSYTEKVWGLPCGQIGAEWGNQRIQGLSLSSLFWNALGKGRSKGQAPKTLIREFYYPRLGPGMMWSRMRQIIEGRNSRVVLHAPVEEIRWERGGVTAVRAGGTVYTGEHFISSIPIRELMQRLRPVPDDGLLEAGRLFRYRDFMTVALMVRGSGLFPDNWIYIHDPAFQVGRIQNFGNWSPGMTADSKTSCLGFEYFCREGDALWTMADEQLVALATRELAQLSLADASAVIDAKVVRVPKAYPVYDGRYQRGIAAVREFLRLVPNLQLVGRNGMHRYNNQDHSMLTAILAARNVLGASYNLWDLSADLGYLEENSGFNAEELRELESTQPRVPAMAAAAGARLRG